MAKRKRLTPPQAEFLRLSPEGADAPRPPIAQVAGEAAAVSALSALSDEWEVARAEGRLIISLPLQEVDPNYLDRDRTAVDEADMDALKQSLLARGQQTPVEVIARDGGRYGLISGWRRYSALQALLRETEDDRFATVQAVLRRPADLAASYVAMVEENEIRSDLSFYERARIVARALEAGVFQTEKEALHGLFGNATYARRSKIKSFLPIVAALGGVLRYPTHLSERAGLALSKALTADPGVAGRLQKALSKAMPETPEAEISCLMAGIKPNASGTESKSGSNKEKSEGPAGIRIASEPGRISLTGPGVTEDLQKRLRIWLQDNA